MNFQLTMTKLTIRCCCIPNTSVKKHGNIVIHTTDPDVFVICLATSHKTNDSLLIRIGTQNKLLNICVSKPKESLRTKYDFKEMKSVSKELLGCHGFTGHSQEKTRSNR